MPRSPSRFRTVEVFMQSLNLASRKRGRRRSPCPTWHDGMLSLLAQGIGWGTVFSYRVASLSSPIARGGGPPPWQHRGERAPSAPPRRHTLWICFKPDWSKRRKTTCAFLHVSNCDFQKNPPTWNCSSSWELQREKWELAVFSSLSVR